MSAPDAMNIRLPLSTTTMPPSGAFVDAPPFGAGRSLLGIILGWEILTRLKIIDPYFFSSPTADREAPPT